MRQGTVGQQGSVRQSSAYVWGGFLSREVFDDLLSAHIGKVLGSSHDNDRPSICIWMLVEVRLASSSLLRHVLWLQIRDPKLVSPTLERNESDAHGMTVNTFIAALQTWLRPTEKMTTACSVTKVDTLVVEHDTWLKSSAKACEPGAAFMDCLVTLS